MEAPHREIEVKFVLPHLTHLRERLLALGAHQLSPRALEVNLRFDNASGALSKDGLVLRLRRDRRTYFTYKAPGSVPEERLEVEVEIDSADDGRRFLEALGYRVVAAYEKYREVFRLGAELVMLDDLPFGHFVEIEADSLERLQAAAEALGLDWDRRITASYVALFETLRSRAGLAAPAATFEHWGDRPVLSQGEIEASARHLQTQRSGP